MFKKLLPRYMSAVRDANRVPGMIGQDSSSGAAEGVTTLSLAAGAVIAPRMALVDSSGNQISSFGGGTQYTDGGTPPTHPVGPTLLFNNAGVWDAVSNSNPLPVSGSFTVGGTTDNSAFTAGTSTGTTALGFYHATLDAVTDGHAAAIAIDSKRSQFMVIRDAALNARGVNVTAANELLVSVNNSSLAVTGTFWQSTQPISAASLPLPSGAATAAKQPALGTAGSASSDVLTVQGIASMTPLKVDGSGVTQPVSGTFWQSTQPVSLVSLPALAAGSNLVGKVGIDQTTLGTTNAVTPVPAANSGWSFSYQSALSNTATQVKGSAGTFGGWAMLFNPNTATTYLQVFNKASASVTLGSTSPDFVIPLPGIASASATGSAANWESVHGIAMSTGITVAATTGAANSTAPSNAVIGTFLYK